MYHVASVSFADFMLMWERVASCYGRSEKACESDMSSPCWALCARSKCCSPRIHWTSPAGTLENTLSNTQWNQIWSLSSTISCQPHHLPAPANPLHDMAPWSNRSTSAGFAVDFFGWKKVPVVKSWASTLLILKILKDTHLKVTSKEYPTHDCRSNMENPCDNATCNLPSLPRHHMRMVEAFEHLGINRSWCHA